MYILATNITSPIGNTTTENYQAVSQGVSAIRCHAEGEELPFPHASSLFSDEQWKMMAIDGCSRFESLVIQSVRESLSHTSIDVKSERVVLILSTTKGDTVSMPFDDGGVMLGDTARHIADELGIVTTPIVVCNACISGASAQILADRLLANKTYDYAIVTGADVQGPFIMSGFHALMALSPQPCRPFDEERIGLNLGEAAATMIMAAGDIPAGVGMPRMIAGAVRNDAYHISSPHPKGEGCYKALEVVKRSVDTEEIACVGVHGTATMYNDQMESKAIERAGLSDVPLSALKGYYGHTMGAAGLLEGILMLEGIRHGEVLPSKGFRERGVSGKVTISSDMLSVQKKKAIKMLSGFGGGNAAIAYDMGGDTHLPCVAVRPGLTRSHSVRITETEIVVDGRKMPNSTRGRDMLTDIYKEHIGDYPKYYKMDTLARLAFVASELLLKAERDDNPDSMQHDEDRAVIFFNRSGSIVSDSKFFSSIRTAEEYFPSPAVFVYTLPNISVGEIALRNGYHGETSFYVLHEKSDTLMDKVLRASFQDADTRSIIGGWIDCTSDEEFECEISIILPNG